MVIRTKALAAGMGVAISLAVVAGFTLLKGPLREQSPPSVRTVVEARPFPSLRCLFFDFTHASVVVGFQFAVAFPKGTRPRFTEQAEAVRNDPAVNFDADNRPIWAYAPDEDGIPMITSPDDATHILLYGLKLGSGDAAWIEAGIRSNTFRNLDGKCLQTHFDEAGDDTNSTPH